MDDYYMKTIILDIDGNLKWKGEISKELQRNDKIDINKITYRVVVVKIESSNQTALVSPRTVSKG